MIKKFINFILTLFLTITLNSFCNDFKKNLNIDNIDGFLREINSGKINKENNFEITLEGNKGFYTFPEAISPEKIQKLIDALGKNISKLVFSNYNLEELFLQDPQYESFFQKFVNSDINCIEILSSSGLDKIEKKYLPKNLSKLIIKNCPSTEKLFSRDLSLQKNLYVIISAKLDQNNIFGFLSEATQAILKNRLHNFSFELIISNPYSISIDLYGFYYGCFIEILKTINKNIHSLILLNLNIAIFYAFQGINVFDLLKESEIKALLLQECSNIDTTFFKKLPKNLSMLAMRNCLLARDKEIQFFFPKTIKNLDLSGLCFTANSQFFESIPNGVEKLKLGCSIPESNLLGLMAKSITALCLKKASLETLNPQDLPDELSKLCFSKDAKSCNFENIKRAIRSIDLTAINPRIWETLQTKKITSDKLKLKVSPEAVLLLGDNQHENCELVVKENSFSRDPRDEDTPKIHKKIEELKKRMKKLTVIKYNNPETLRIIPQCPFKSSSNMCDELESQGSPSGSFGSFSPESDVPFSVKAKSPVGLSPKSNKSPASPKSRLKSQMDPARSTTPPRINFGEVFC